MLERFREKKILHPAAQLVIYQYFNETHGARFYFLKEQGKDRQITLPETEIADAGALLAAIEERLDEIIGGEELAPMHHCQDCKYCQFQALCGREDYYKTTRSDS